MRNKLSFYEQAGMDSLKREEALRNDPNILKSPEPVSEMIFEDYTPAKEKYSPEKHRCQLMKLLKRPSIIR